MKKIGQCILVIVLGLCINHAAFAGVFSDEYVPGEGVFLSNDQALLNGSRRGDLPVVQRALRQKANVNVSNQNGWTPLQEACENGHLKIVKLLLENGAYLDQTDREGRTALYWASKSGQKSVVEYLLQKGAKCNIAKTTDGHTPLHAAVFYNKPEVADVLLKHGANPYQEDRFGVTPFRLSAMSKKKMFHVFENNMRKQ